MCWQQVCDVGLAENSNSVYGPSGALRGTTADGQMPVKYHDFYFSDFIPFQKFHGA